MQSGVARLLGAEEERCCRREAPERGRRRRRSRSLQRKEVTRHGAGANDKQNKKSTKDGNARLRYKKDATRTHTNAHRQLTSRTCRTLPPQGCIEPWPLRTSCRPLGPFARRRSPRIRGCLWRSWLLHALPPPSGGCCARGRARVRVLRPARSLLPCAECRCQPSSSGRGALSIWRPQNANENRRVR